MRIDNEMMARLAALSKLELSQTELKQLSGQLETIVKYMDILAQLPVENTPCADQPPLLCNVFRKDRVTSSYDRSELLSNASETDGETLCVPKTVE